MKHAHFIVSLCAMAAATSGVAILGCSAASTTPKSADAGTGVYDNGDAAQGPEATAATPEALTPVVYLVHAATGLGNVRICFTPDTNPAQPSDVHIPQTNYAGLAVGGSVFHRDGNKLDGAMLDKAFAVSAEGLGAAEYGRSTPFTCAELEANPLVNKLYFAPTVLDTRGATIVALLGCPPNVGDASRCGKTFDLQKGNLSLVAVRVGGVVPETGSVIGTFVLNLSPSVEANVNGAMATARVGALASACSAVNTEIFKSPFTVGSLAPAAKDIASPTAFDTDGFAACRQTGAPIVVRSYAELQAATVPESLPADHFQARSDYVFTIVGDVSVASGPEAVHALAIRFDGTR